MKFGQSEDDFQCTLCSQNTCSCGNEGTSVPHGYSLWHLNVALIDLPNDCLDTQDVPGNTEGGRRDPLKREADIKALQVHTKCWGKKIK